MLFGRMLWWRQGDSVSFNAGGKNDDFVNFIIWLSSGDRSL